MAAILWSDIVAFAPFASSIAAGAQTDILSLVNDTIDSDCLGGESGIAYRLARIYLGTHYAAMVQSSTENADGVQSESAGGLNISYTQNGLFERNIIVVGAAGYAQTPYGQMYLQLLKTSCFRLPVVL
jgi:Protein of unknown function (DUF4054)